MTAAKDRQLAALRRVNAWKKTGYVRRKHVIPAPAWLVDRMARSAAAPPPTLEEVRIQMRASEKFREEQCAREMFKRPRPQYVR